MMTETLRITVRFLLLSMRRSISIMVGGIVLLFMLMAAVFAPLLTQSDPWALSVDERLTPPNVHALLGTDNLGRDLFSRVLYGARLSLIVGGATALCSGIGGIVLGLLGGYRRMFSGVIMRVVDGMMALPGTLLALAMMAVLGPSNLNVVIALSVAYMPRVARVEHASTLQVTSREYVLAAVAIGCSDTRVLLRHVLPNTLAPVLVQITFTFAYAVIAEAGLSFLGVGAPPDVPSWGNIIAGGRDYLLVAPWITVIPGIAVLLVVLSLNLIGDGFRDVLDPRLRGQRATSLRSILKTGTTGG
jgi:peptide/nickel transport system permease protein